MDKDDPDMNEKASWSDIRAFLAIARAGSFTAAAEAAGTSQPTLSRRIAALEAALGGALFDRSVRGAALTALGVEILNYAKEMEDAAAHLSLAAAGRREEIAGTVRITASRVVSTFHLPEILSALQREEPSLQIELVASDATENLLLREADIALRMYRPTQNDVIARHVGDFTLGLYAAKNYLYRNGVPASPVDLSAHRFVGYDRSDLILKGFAAMGFPVSRDFSAFHTDDQVAYWRAVVSGAGIGAMQRLVGDAEPRVARILPDLRLPTMPLWLAAHEELRSSRRVRRVFDHLVDAFTALTLRPGRATPTPTN
jgi:DNA-binding transcriptional LysR family regulator